MTRKRTWKAAKLKPRGSVRQKKRHNKLIQVSTVPDSVQEKLLAVFNEGDKESLRLPGILGRLAQAFVVNRQCRTLFFMHSRRPNSRTESDAGTLATAVPAQLERAVDGTADGGGIGGTASQPGPRSTFRKSSLDARHRSATWPRVDAQIAW